MKESFLRKVEICKEGEGLNDNRLRGVLIELIFNSVLIKGGKEVVILSDELENEGKFLSLG